MPIYTTYKPKYVLIFIPGLSKVASMYYLSSIIRKLQLSHLPLSSAVSFSYFGRYIVLFTFLLPWGKKYHDNLKKGRIIWANSSRGVRGHYGRDAWRQEVGMVADARAWEITSQPHIGSTGWGKDYILKARPQWWTSSTKLNLPITSPSSSITWGPSVQMPEPMGTVLIQTTTEIVSIEWIYSSWFSLYFLHS